MCVLLNSGAARLITTATCVTYSTEAVEVPLLPSQEPVLARANNISLARRQLEVCVVHMLSTTCIFDCRHCGLF